MRDIQDLLEEAFYCLKLSEPYLPRVSVAGNPLQRSALSSRIIALLEDAEIAFPGIADRAAKFGE